MPKADAIDIRLLVPPDVQVLQAQSGDLDIAATRSRRPTGRHCPPTRRSPTASWTPNARAVLHDPRYLRAGQPVRRSARAPGGQPCHRQGEPAASRRWPGHGRGLHPAPRGPRWRCRLRPLSLLGRYRQGAHQPGREYGFSTQLYTTPTTRDLGESIAADLKVIGIDVEVIPQDFDVFLGTVGKPHGAPMSLTGWGSGFPDPSEFIDPLVTCGAAVEGGSNTSWYCDPALDKDLAAARELTGRADVDLDVCGAPGPGHGGGAHRAAALPGPDHPQVRPAPHVRQSSTRSGCGTSRPTPSRSRRQPTPHDGRRRHMGTAPLGANGAVEEEVFAWVRGGHASRRPRSARRHRCHGPPM